MANDTRHTFVSKWQKQLPQLLEFLACFNHGLRVFEATLAKAPVHGKHSVEFLQPKLGSAHRRAGSGACRATEGANIIYVQSETHRKHDIMEYVPMGNGWKWLFGRKH